MLILHKHKERITNSRDGKNSKVESRRPCKYPTNGSKIREEF